MKPKVTCLYPLSLASTGGRFGNTIDQHWSDPGQRLREFCADAAAEFLIGVIAPRFG